MEYNEDTLIQAIATEVRMCLAGKRWTQQDLADKVGITRETMSRYMSGKKQMPMTTFFRVADVLGLSPRELMRRAEIRVEEDSKV